MKDIFCYYQNPTDTNLEFVVNYFVLFAKFYIHKQKYSNHNPNINHFVSDLMLLLRSLKYVKDSKNDKFLNIYNSFFSVTPVTL